MNKGEQRCHQRSVPGPVGVAGRLNPVLRSCLSCVVPASVGGGGCPLSGKISQGRTSERTGLGPLFIWFQFCVWCLNLRSVIFDFSRSSLLFVQETNIAPFTASSHEVFVVFHAQSATLPSGFRLTWSS